MSAKKHIVKLTPDERVDLEKVSSSNRHSIRQKTRARLLLGSDTGLSREAGGSQSDVELAVRFKVSALTVASVRKRAHERGALGALTRQEQLKRKARKISGEQEAHLVALTCSTPPDGASRWTLQLVREKAIEWKIIEPVSQETIRTTLKKTLSNRG